jgi:hypothetical protein
MGNSDEIDVAGAPGDGAGLSRRDALRKGAVVGGAVLWAAPVVQGIGLSPASAQPASPRPGPDLKAISFIVFRFRCGTQNYAVKIDAPGTGDEACGAIPGDNPGQGCGLEAQPGDVNGGDACSLFTLQPALDAEGEVTMVTVVLGGGCTFLSGFSKCGSPKSTTTPCVPATSPTAGTGVFLGCPDSQP